MNDNKIYFNPGAIVMLNKDIPNKPIMYVIGKKTSLFKSKDAENDEEYLKGILCRWFSVDGKLQEALFNTKDLELIK